MKIGKKVFQDTGHTYIMGILNVTPDSFSDGGKWNSLDAALFQTETMIADGMDIVDVGGESTRPGYEKITDEEEISRVVPVIEAIKQRFDVPISLDTYKSGVAKAGITAGADLINDIWGLQNDSKMAGVIAQGKVACCMMHNREEAVYENFLEDCIADLQRSVELGLQAGIERDRIMIDPGVGFAKSYEQNLQVIKHLDAFHRLGFPVLLGASRKSVIGNTLQLPVTEREEGTLVTTVFAACQKVSFVRVHDVKKSARAIQMAEAILNA